MNTKIVILVCLSALSCGVFGWGDTGHQTIAAIAQNLISSKTNDAVTQILGGASMESVATWADDVRRESEWSWSAPLHYIDTPDDMCSYVYSRDCTADGISGFCVAGAITNFTKQMSPATAHKIESRFMKMKRHRVNLRLGLQDVTQDEALKFVIHFVGDIHQPLHVGFTTDRGGNSISVEWYTRKENLHAVWDEYIINKMLDDFYSGSADTWVSALTEQIKTGNYSQQQPAWASCHTGAEECTTIYATESITFACANSYECIAGSDPCSSEKVVDGSRLGDEYYLQAYPVVNLRIAQAAVRLAALLDYVFG